MTENYCLPVELIKLRDNKSHKRITPRIALAIAVLMLVSGGWLTSRAFRPLAAPARPSDETYAQGKQAFDSAQSPEDYLKAARWIRQAAAQGNPKAQTALAVLYLKGLGVHQDVAAGVNCLRQAAAQNYAVAQNELAVMYATGKNLPQDLEQALYWCGRAAAQGEKTAEKNLALIQTARRSVQSALAASSPYPKVVLQRITSQGLMVSFEPAKGGLGLARLKAENLSTPLKQLCGLTPEKSRSLFSLWSHPIALASAL